MRTVIVQSAWWHQLSLLGQRRTESSVLDTQLVDECTTLFPAPVCFVGGCEGGVEERGARLELFYMPCGGYQLGPDGGKRGC